MTAAAGDRRRALHARGESEARAAQEESDGGSRVGMETNNEEAETVDGGAAGRLNRARLKGFGQVS